MAGALPKYFQRLEQGKRFCFSCHTGVPCFTECCRELDLALTPYDVLRLRNKVWMNSTDFLKQYIIIEQSPDLAFPICYLTMVDDGRASCVFVAPAGCTVYEDRPAACRAYPVGRGASRENNGRVRETLVLVREPHCLGFAGTENQTASEYFHNQGLDHYNRRNDELMILLQHERLRRGFRPTRRQQEQFIMALYKLDLFRQEMSSGRINMKRPLTVAELQGLAGDDEQLLRLGGHWLQQEFFNE